MVVKHVHLGQNGQSKLKSGIKKIAGAVKSTLGARGRTVLIESEHHVGGITVTKDGVTVAKSINLFDPTENLAVMMMRQAAEKTATVAGDGTTTSIVLAEAILDASDQFIDGSTNVTQVIREINDITSDVTKHLTKKSKKVTGKRLLDVATISSNNDKELGSMIAGAFKEVDVVTVENSMSSSTYVEIIKGMKIDRGMTSPYFVTDQKKGECVLDNPYVLITDHEINNLVVIEEILKYCVVNQKPLLIIGTLGQNALNTLNLNVAKGQIKACNIIPPSFGFRTKDLLDDLAAALGGTFFSESTGDDLSLARIDDLGRANRIVVSKGMSVIMPNADREQNINERIEMLKESKSENESNKEMMDFVNERIANLSGGVGVIYVGALSDIEQKEKRDRVDDAVCAVQAALEEGILPGGGIALRSYAMTNLMEPIGVAESIMHFALQAPFKQILDNAGKDCDEIDSNMLPFENEGYDVKNDTYGDMYKMGIIDPTKVTRNALLNAVSVATTIMSTNAIITNVRADEGIK